MRHLGYMNWRPRKRRCAALVMMSVLDDRIPSVREYAVMLEVNTNTAVKTYDELSRANIIYNKRGLGYFVTPGAREQIMQERRRLFMEQQLPALFRQMRLLGITQEELLKVLHSLKYY